MVDAQYSTLAEECMACRTAAGAHAAEEVYRDDRVVAVVAQHAVNPGHLVVVTLEHVRNALTMENDLLCHMMLVARDLAERLREALPCSGVMLVFNNEAPCQTLFHAHLHVVPRHAGDEMDRTFGASVEPEERAAIALRLRDPEHLNTRTPPNT
jgi:histidine triad (HIT) family protein